MLIIKVRHPEKYCERGGPLKRALHRANYKKCGSPVALSTRVLKANLSELLDIFNEYWEKYGPK